MNKRLFVIGDIHGMYDKLMSLMKKVNSELTENDTLLFLGDYIDRGPDSFKVVEYLIQLKNKICLMGNHEAMLDSTLNHSINSILWIQNGGGSTINSYKEEFKDCTIEEALIKSKHDKFYKNLKMFHETDDFFFVHAGISPTRGLAWSKKDLPTLIWIRDDFLTSDNFKDTKKMIVHGHSIELDGPIFKNNRIGIDTGSFLPKGKISCVVLPDCTVLQSD